MTQQAQQPEQPQQEQRLTIPELKAKVCTALQNKFNTPAMRERLIALAGGDESLVITNLNSFLTILANDEGTGKWDSKKYLVQASTSSLALCFLESMQIGIPIDRRGLCHIVVYGIQAELEIDYKGFIYYLNKHYKEATFDVRLVFEGDHFNYWSESGDDKYSYKMAEGRKGNDYNKVEWAFMFMTYVKNNREHSKIEVMDRKELDLVKSKAKTKAVWDEWTGEMYKKAVVRRACKLPLAAVDENAVEAIDNKNFELNRQPAADRLQLLMEKQKEITSDEKPPEQAQPNGGDSKPAGKVSDNGEPPKVEADKPVEPQKPAEEPHSPDNGGNIPPEGGTAPESANPADSAVIDGTFENVTEAPAAPVEVPPPAPENGWDGETIRVNGKDQRQQFATPAAAANYLRKIMASRKSKASRKQMIEENPKLMAALIKSGQGSAIAELHKLADAGA